MLTPSTELFSIVSTFCLVRISAVGFSVDSIANFHAAAISTASPWRITCIFGIDLNIANCSIGWWVGPSSPTAIESWDNGKIIGNFIKQAILTAALK